jgi:hypothetical protein
VYLTHWRTPSAGALLPDTIAYKTSIRELGEMLTHIVKHMATKEDEADHLYQGCTMC